jgi:outer membrane lipoprotein-sorting protein
MRLLCAVMLLCFLVIPVEGVAAPEVKSVQANFVQEKNMAILARPLLSRGRFLFQAPASLRWEYFTPLHSILLMDDGKIRKFVKTKDEFVEERSMGLSAMQMVLQEITGWLDGDITDTPTFLAKRVAERKIILTPRKPALSKIISQVELQLLDDSGLMKSVTLYEGEDSFTRMVFSDAVVNLEIAKSSFKGP